MFASSIRLLVVLAVLVASSCGVDAPITKPPFRSLRQPISTTLVISEVYGGGGGSSSRFRYDFIELLNVGSTPINLNGWSVQYASEMGSSWTVTPLTGTVQPGRNFLIRMGTQGSGTNLPTPDDTGTTSMSATAGKVALVDGMNALTTACPNASRYVDLVGYGTNTNCAEGNTSTGNTSASSSVRRNGNGCSDTDNNAADFTVGTPTPRNAAAGANTCSPVITDGGVIPTPDGGCLTLSTWATADGYGGYSAGNTTASAYLDTAPMVNGRVDTLTLEAFFGGMPVLTLPATRTFSRADTYGSCEVCAILERNCDAMGACTEQYFAQSGTGTVTTATQDEGLGRLEGSLSNVRFVAWDFTNDEAAPSGACVVLGSAIVSVAWDADGGVTGGGAAGGGSAAGGSAGGGSAGGSSAGGSSGGGSSAAGGAAGGFMGAGGGFNLPDSGKADGGTGTTPKKPCGCSSSADGVLLQFLGAGLIARLFRRREQRGVSST